MAEILTEKFSLNYPYIPISRPSRFLDTVRRVAAPTKTSAIGQRKLVGSPLASYRCRHWIPRTRHKPGTCMGWIEFIKLLLVSVYVSISAVYSTGTTCLKIIVIILFFIAAESNVFPKEVQNYGVTESLLQRAFLQCIEGREDLCWTLSRPVTTGFYRDLHHYLRPTSRSASKTTVGRFYLLIDVNFQSRTMLSRPDNIYMFVQRVANSSKSCTEHMYYGIDKKVKHLKSVVSGYQADLEEMSQKVSEQQKALEELKMEMEIARTEVASSRRALSDVTSKLHRTITQRDTARKQVSKTQEKVYAAYADSVYYEEELQAKNDHLIELVKSLESELSTLSAADLTHFSVVDHGGDAKFCFQTKEGGRVYTTAVRELYYKLLADQLPPAKIASTIKSVLKSFLPLLDVDSLKLPGESCALYMRRQELTTVNLAHNAVSLLDQAQSGCLNLNCDGTTLSQKKLQGAAISGTIIAVNEIPDGSAKSMIADISHDLQKLREIAHTLHLPNADKLNWTLIKSSSSDSAATQKKFNKLVEEKRQEDSERFGPRCGCPDVMELVENFCCMHLGVNLRKAFFDAARTSTDSHSSDILVHEFCKLLGKHGAKHGVPEYGHGAIAFPDFLELMSSESLCNSSEANYYQQCEKIKLDRQVGSRYFVTAANSGKILVLREAAISFLKYAGKEKGNKLEQSVFQKLQDPLELAHLKADATMFHHVYCNLVMLGKSCHLNKNVLDMNQHYLELKMFLLEVEHDPETAMNRDHEVFTSERRHYGKDKKVNHRLHPSYKTIEEAVFTRDGTDECLLYPLLASGATSMKEKLFSYAQNQLPGGKYWEPDPDVKTILKSLKPNNDICESILGLNDYLSTVIPNMHQMSKSNLVQAKKNKTVQWLDTLPSDQQHDIVELARKSRVQVKKPYQKAEVERCKYRQDKMIREKNSRDALQKRAAEEKERLSKLHLIESTDELKEVLSEIDEEGKGTAAKRGQKKRALIREHISIRKKVLQENINIPFTTKGKQRPLSDIVKEFSAHLQCDGHGTCSVVANTRSYTSESLVGRSVLHKFEVDNEGKWFSGFIVSYNPRTHLHEIAYDEEQEHCFFNLLEDLSKGDLIVQND